jgi:epoxyqueuosine reductase QueG
VDRFGDAPKGFHPCDVLPECRSVVVLASSFLKSALRATSTVPYTIVRNEMSRRMDRLSLELADRLEAEGFGAVPTGAIGPVDWDAETNRFRGLISLKHAAVQAGLGKIGKNTLLVNDKYGNMLWLTAVLVSAELDADPIAAYEGCRPDCRLCLDSCPTKALDGVTIDQMVCFANAFAKDVGGEQRIKCFTCRKVCPNALGIKTPC